MRIACAQIVSSADPAANLALVGDYTRRAADAGITVFAGMFTPATDGRVTNTVLATGGGVEDRYDKIHLFDAFGFTESETIAPGHRPVVVTVDGIGVGITLCYDIRFPGLYTELADRGASVITVSASWAPGPGAGLHLFHCRGRTGRSGPSPRDRDCAHRCGRQPDQLSPRRGTGLRRRGPGVAGPRRRYRQRRSGARSASGAAEPIYRSHRPIGQNRAGDSAPTAATVDAPVDAATGAPAGPAAGRARAADQTPQRSTIDSTDRADRVRTGDCGTARRRVVRPA